MHPSGLLPALSVLRRLVFGALTAVAVLIQGCGGGTSGEAPTPAPAAPVDAPGLYLLAGNIGGAGNLDGQGINARFDGPKALSVTGSGDIYVGDVPLRKVTQGGAVTTIGGNPWSSYGGKDGPLAQAEFYDTSSIALGPNGVVFLMDYTGLHRITPDGTSELVFGTRTAFVTIHRTVAADSVGNAFVTEGTSVWKVAPEGAPSVFASLGANLQDIASDSAGNLYVIESRVEGGPAVTKITPSGAVSLLADTAAGGLVNPTRITTDASGTVYVVDQGHVKRITQDGTVTTLPLGAHALMFSNEHPAADIAVDAAGNIYLADGRGHSIVKVTAAGASAIHAGLPGSKVNVDGNGSAAEFGFAGLAATGVALLAKDAAGSFHTPVYNYVNGLVTRKITPQGTVTTRVYPGTSWEAGQRRDRIFEPAGFAMDNSGNAYLVSGRLYLGMGYYEGGAAIHRITPAGEMTVFAGSSLGETGTADGTGSQARFSANPSGAVVDAAGNLFVGDGNAVRKITPAGVVTTLARGFLVPSEAVNAAVWSLAIDAAGTLYAACSDLTLRKITAAGVVTTLATGIVPSRGAGAGGGIYAPAVAVDEAGDVYVGNGMVVQRVTPAGSVSTVAGVPGQVGIRLGTLPGALYGPSGMVYAGDRTLVLASGGAVLKLVLP